LESGSIILSKFMILRLTLCRLVYTCSKIERSKDHNKATAVTIKLQRSNALICFTEQTIKRIENAALLHLRPDPHLAYTHRRKAE